MILVKQALNVGISADTAVFSVESIRRWWYEVGVVRYPTAKLKLDIPRYLGGFCLNPIKGLAVPDGGFRCTQP